MGFRNSRYCHRSEAETKAGEKKLLCCNPIMMLIKFHSFCTFDGIRINLSTENTLLDLYGNDTGLLWRFLDLANIFQGCLEWSCRKMFSFIHQSEIFVVRSIVDRTLDGFSIELRDTSALQSFPSAFEWKLSINQQSCLSIKKFATAKSTRLLLRWVGR